MNRENLEKLASYLEELPEDYEHFGMSSYFKNNNGVIFYVDRSPLAGECGTVACAVGHGPAAGIEPSGHENWVGYARRAFDLSTSQERWCFSGAWAVIDDTPQGAAKRIRYMLKYGLPEDAYEQCWGEAPYMFAKETA